jgi:NTE family protein
MTGRGAARAARRSGIRGPRAEKTVSLALQGGGAHGAFTWGVLDALLEDGRLAFEAFTGASAGAMNAVVLVEGWLEGGVDRARSQLEQFWRRVSSSAACSRPGGMIGAPFSPQASALTSSTRSTSIRCGTRLPN